MAGALWVSLGRQGKKPPTAPTEPEQNGYLLAQDGRRLIAQDGRRLKRQQ